MIACNHCNQMPIGALRQRPQRAAQGIGRGAGDLLLDRGVRLFQIG